MQIPCLGDRVNVISIECNKQTDYVYARSGKYSGAIKLDAINALLDQLR